MILMIGCHMILMIGCHMSFNTCLSHDFIARLSHDFNAWLSHDFFSHFLAVYLKGEDFDLTIEMQNNTKQSLKTTAKRKL